MNGGGGGKVGNGVSVEEDLRLAWLEVMEAVRLLRKAGGGLERDGEELMEVIEGCGVW